MYVWKTVCEEGPMGMICCKKRSIDGHKEKVNNTGNKLV